MSSINLDFEKYQIPFLKNEELQKEIFLNGYAVRNFLNKKKLESFKDVSYKILSKIPIYQRAFNFISVGRLKNHNIINLSSDSIRNFILPELSSFFFDNVEIVSGVHLIKPPSPISKLNPHQDSSLVDEKKYISIYAWIPLQDTNTFNGTLAVLPQSHLFGNYQRSLNIYWQFEPYLKVINKFMKSIPVNAGQVVFFDSSLIHSSPPNFSFKTRLAINLFIKPKVADYLHYYSETPKAKTIDIYKVSPDFFYNNNILDRPPYPYKIIETQDRIDIKLTVDVIKNICKNTFKT